MIVNAQLQRIDTPQAASATGDVTYTTGATIGVDCCLDEPTSSQKFTLGVVVSDATAVMYVAFDALAGATIAKRMRLLVQLGTFAAALYEVIYVRSRVHDGQDHYEAYLKGV